MTGRCTQPFSERVTSPTTEGTPNPLQYTARDLDATTGLYYVRNRWYDPEVGRFVSEDPIRLSGGINLYTYAENNPISLTDPFGLCPGPGCLPGITVRVPPHPCSVAATTGFFWDSLTSRSVFCFGSDTDLYGVPDMPHHRKFGTPAIARRALYGPWSLTREQADQIECIASNWLSPGARTIVNGAQILTADLGAIYNRGDASAVTLNSTTIVIASGNGLRDPLVAFDSRNVAYMLAHEVRHITQYVTQGYEAFNALYSTPEGELALESDASRYAYHNVGNGPSCSPGGVR